MNLSLWVKGQGKTYSGNSFSPEVACLQLAFVDKGLSLRFLTGQCRRRSNINFPRVKRKGTKVWKPQRQSELISTELEWRGQKNAGSTVLSGAGSFQGKSPAPAPRGRQVFKGQLNYLTSAQGMLYDSQKLCVGAGVCSTQCPSTVLFSGHAQSQHFRPSLQNWGAPPPALEQLWTMHYFAFWRTQRLAEDAELTRTEASVGASHAPGAWHMSFHSISSLCENYQQPWFSAEETEPQKHKQGLVEWLKW
jgi:hypothetical protein